MMCKSITTNGTSGILKDVFYTSIANSKSMWISEWYTHIRSNEWYLYAMTICWYTLRLKEEILCHLTLLFMLKDAIRCNKFIFRNLSQYRNTCCGCILMWFIFNIILTYVVLMLLHMH